MNIVESTARDKRILKSRKLVMAGFDALLSGNQSLPYAKVIVQHLHAWMP